MDTSQLNLGILLDVYFHCMKKVLKARLLEASRWLFLFTHR